LVIGGISAEVFKSEHLEGPRTDWELAKPAQMGEEPVLSKAVAQDAPEVRSAHPSHVGAWDSSESDA